MIIKIKNSEGEFITRQQADQLADYSVCYYDNNNVLLKEEEIEDNKPSLLKYYNVNNEPHQTIFNTHNTKPEFVFLIIDIEVFAGNYRLEKRYHYKTSNMDLYHRLYLLFDPNGYLIGQEVYWINNPTPDYNFTRKYYYDLTQNLDDYLFQAKFDKTTGAFESIYFPQLHIDPYEQSSIGLGNTPQDIQALRALTGISQELAEYYTVPEVIPNF